MKLIYMHCFVLLLIAVTNVFCELNDDGDVGGGELELDEEAIRELVKHSADPYRGGRSGGRFSPRVSPRYTPRVSPRYTPRVSRRRYSPSVSRRRSSGGNGSIRHTHETKQLVFVVLLLALGVIYSLI